MSVCRRQIPDILLAFTQPQIEDMQRNLGKIWHRYRPQCNSSCAATSHVCSLQPVPMQKPADET